MLLNPGSTSIPFTPRAHRRLSGERDHRLALHFAAVVYLDRPAFLGDEDAIGSVRGKARQEPEVGRVGKPGHNSGSLEVGRRHYTADRDGLGVGVAAFADQSECDKVEQARQPMNVKVAAGVADGDGERGPGVRVVIRIGREDEGAVGIDENVTLSRRGSGVGEVGAVGVDGVTLPVITPLAAMFSAES